jgi:hypothetical protein
MSLLDLWYPPRVTRPIPTLIHATSDEALQAALVARRQARYYQKHKAKFNADTMRRQALRRQQGAPRKSGAGQAYRCKKYRVHLKARALTGA